MIGEAHDHLGKAGEAHIDDKGAKEDPAQELDQLEGENEERVNSLSGRICVCVFHLGQTLIVIYR